MIDNAGSVTWEAHSIQGEKIIVENDSDGSNKRCIDPKVDNTTVKRSDQNASRDQPTKPSKPKIDENETDEKITFTTAYFRRRIEALDAAINSFTTSYSPSKEQKKFDTGRTLSRINLAGEIITTNPNDDDRARKRLGSPAIIKSISNNQIEMMITRSYLTNKNANDFRQKEGLTLNHDKSNTGETCIFTNKKNDNKCEINNRIRTCSDSREIPMGKSPLNRGDTIPVSNTPEAVLMVLREGVSFHRLWMASWIIMATIIIFGIGMLFGYLSYIIREYSMS